MSALIIDSNALESVFDFIGTTVFQSTIIDLILVKTKFVNAPLKSNLLLKNNSTVGRLDPCKISIKGAWGQSRKGREQKGLC